jgi:hypothetical protein
MKKMHISEYFKNVHGTLEIRKTFIMDSTTEHVLFTSFSGHFSPKNELRHNSGVIATSEYNIPDKQKERMAKRLTQFISVIGSYDMTMTGLRELVFDSIERLKCS